jgi:hypothetical protein
MAIIFEREIHAPIGTVREELASMAWERAPDRLPIGVRARSLGLTHGRVGVQRFALAFERDWYRTGVELHGRLTVASPAVTRVRVRCGVSTVHRLIGHGVLLCLAAWIVVSGNGFGVFIGLVVLLQLGWLVKRDRGISRTSDPAARYLVERVEEGLATAEARAAASGQAA